MDHILIFESKPLIVYIFFLILLDPFFNTQVLTDGDLQWNDKLVAAAASPVDVNSAGAIQKQANIHHDGENISAKIDQIRQQNDWLFIRKLKVSVDDLTW